MTGTEDAPGGDAGGWVTADELAARLGVTGQTVRHHARHGTWLPPATRIAGRWAWPAAALEGVEDLPRPKVGNPNWRRVAAAPPAGAPERPTHLSPDATEPEPGFWE